MKYLGPVKIWYGKGDKARVIDMRELWKDCNGVIIDAYAQQYTLDKKGRARMIEATK